MAKKKGYDLSIGDVSDHLELIALITRNPDADNIARREKVMKGFMKRHQKELGLTNKYIEEYKVKLG